MKEETTVASSIVAILFGYHVQFVSFVIVLLHQELHEELCSCKGAQTTQRSYLMAIAPLTQDIHTNEDRNISVHPVSLTKGWKRISVPTSDPFMPSTKGRNKQDGDNTQNSFNLPCKTKKAILYKIQFFFQLRRQS
jgi:hypothetical protein